MHPFHVSQFFYALVPFGSSFISPLLYLYFQILFCLSLSPFVFLAVPLSIFSSPHSLPLHERFIEQTREAHFGCYWWKRLQDISSVMSEWFFLSPLMTSNSVRPDVWSFLFLYMLVCLYPPSLLSFLDCISHSFLFSCFVAIACFLLKCIIMCILVAHM